MRLDPFYIVSVMLLSCGLLFAESYSIQTGVGHSNKHQNGSDKIRYLEVNQRHTLGVFEQQVGMGHTLDDTDFNNSRGFSYAEILYGLEVKRDGHYVEYLVGPAFISKTDKRLGSHFQFSHELGIGLKDVRGVRIGVVIGHFSNAGIKKPNFGLNTVGLKVGF